MKALRFLPFSQRCGLLRIHLVVRTEDNAIPLARALDRDDAKLHVFSHGLRIAVEWIAVAAAAGRADNHDVVAPDRMAGHLTGRVEIDFLPIATDREMILTSGAAAEHAVRRDHAAVAEHRIARFLVDEPDFTAHAGAPAFHALAAAVEAQFALFHDQRHLVLNRLHVLDRGQIAEIDVGERARAIGFLESPVTARR